MHLNKLINNLNIVLVFGITVSLLVYLTNYSLGFQSTFFIGMFSILSLIFICVQRRRFVLGCLIGTFFLIVSLRLASLAGLKLFVICWAVALLIQVILFLMYMLDDIKKSKEKNTIYLWQVVFIRIFVGYDLIPHFCEKLFAGNVVRAEDVKAFIGLGISNPLDFVLLAGIIELLGSFAVSCGLFTRLSTLCLTIYLMVSTIMGHHFSLGFIWASKGGGWEFPVLWSVIILTFTFTKPMLFSLDKLLFECEKLKKIRKIISII